MIGLLWLFASTQQDVTKTVVVELFTSEGCSSCPPAEALVAMLREKATKDHQPVFFLTEHVDYWDHLGWSDRFSSSEASERQRDLSEHLSAHALYTPQMIVDGRVEFVGADRQRAEKEIERALSLPDSLSLHLDASRKGKSVSVEVELTHPPAKLPERLYLAVAAVEDRTVEILGGENAGRTLAHPAVVRAMKETHLQGVKVNLVLDLPEDAQPTQIIAFIESDNGIEGAASVLLTP